MQHLVVADYGTFLGYSEGLLVIKRGDEIGRELPLNRIKTVTIAKQGVALSAALICNLSQRGIKLFFLDFKGEPVACLSGVQNHAVCAVRKRQFECVESARAGEIAVRLISGKVANQRAVLKYFGKYHSKQVAHIGPILDEASLALEDSLRSLKELAQQIDERWRNRLMGIEGNAAAVYWAALRESKLLPPVFERRFHRNSTDAVNKAFNYGYAVLSSAVWQCVINAGFEPYAGLLHVDRPGKPALVLDLMEEYRPWVVDRVVIKERQMLEGQTLTDAAKKAVLSGVLGTLGSRYPHRGRRLSLESIMQRQVYRLGGVFSDSSKRYRPMIFKW
jgi:CRISPR-associated protein Cas1